MPVGRTLTEGYTECSSEAKERQERLRPSTIFDHVTSNQSDECMMRETGEVETFHHI